MMSSSAAEGASLEPLQGKWSAKGAGEDATVTFVIANGKVTGVTMKPLSPLADFSYDFQHLAFVPVG